MGRCKVFHRTLKTCPSSFSFRNCLIIGKLSYYCLTMQRYEKMRTKPKENQFFCSLAKTCVLKSPPKSQKQSQTSSDFAEVHPVLGFIKCGAVWQRVSPACPWSLPAGYTCFASPIRDGRRSRPSCRAMTRLSTVSADLCRKPFRTTGSVS